ncbi:MAG: type II toxin-antitoxin system VapC family toxin [Candidatus Helarchaeota archaeon]
MGVLIDTGFFFSLKIKRDRFHDKVKTFFENTDWKSYGLIVTSNLVVNELYTLVNIRTKGNSHALTRFDDLIWGEENFFKIVFLSPQEFIKTASIIKKYSTPTRILSFVDASLTFLARKLKITMIISNDGQFDGILTRIPISDKK